MFLAGLIDLGADPKKIIAELCKLNLNEQFDFDLKTVISRGFEGKRLKIIVKRAGQWCASDEPQASDHHHQAKHHHRTHADIKSIISASALADRVKDRSLSVFHALAVAEGQVHGKPADQVHFHEVGAIDSILDIVGCCVALELLSIEKLYSTSVGIASGHVMCAHGQLPLPAPATLLLLKGAPVVHQGPNQELCTPTGAAILKALATFSPPPQAMVQSIGNGMSHRIPKNAPPFLRLTLLKLGNRSEPSQAQRDAFKLETLLNINCDIDDMSPELMPLICEQLLNEDKALDVSTSATLMKKGRHGFHVSVLCHSQQQFKVMERLLNHTSSFGCKVQNIERWSLERETRKIDSPWGPVRIKHAIGTPTPKYHIEYEDVAKICREHQVPQFHVLQTIQSHINP